MSKKIAKPVIDKLFFNKLVLLRFLRYWVILMSQKNSYIARKFSNVGLRPIFYISHTVFYSANGFDEHQWVALIRKSRKTTNCLICLVASADNAKFLNSWLLLN